MSSSYDKKDRKVVPRWRSFSTTALLGEADSSRRDDSAEKPTEDFLASKLAAWRQRKTLWHATEAIGAALVLARPKEAEEAASFVLGQSSASSVSRKLASKILGDGESANSDGSMGLPGPATHAVRRNLADYHHDPIGWVDLALHYTIIGHLQQADRAIRTALQLSPNSRFVVRSAARHYVHQERLDHAHAVLKNAPSTQFDPWLLAAEIAVASAGGMQPKFIKQGRLMVEDEAFKRSHLSELASALATIELTGGNSRKARKLFKKALLDPTENSVAQAMWASKVGGASLTANDFDVPRLFEAQTWENFFNANWNSALEFAYRWFDDQPFSSRPALMASYITSAIFEKYEETITLLKVARLANPTEAIILNNLAFAYTNLGRLAEAEEAFNVIDRSKLSASASITVTATAGAIQFLRHDVERGRALYSQAVDEAAKSGLRKERAAAAVNWAIQEIKAETEKAGAVRSLALAAADEMEQHPDIVVLRKRLETRSATPAIVVG